jgi:endonuclease III related protein
MAARIERGRLLAIFAHLFSTYGPQDWWPAKTPFEVMVGAVLTQHTSWTHVVRGLERLGARAPLTARAILALPETELADCLRPVGYFNIKARRLRAFCAAYLDQGEQNGLSRLTTAELRHRLLGVKGVGPETADDILLYAFDRPVFVVDAYTRRIFSRLGELAGNEGYETIRHSLETTLGPDIALYNEYHALIVRHGKEICRTKPRCGECCLADCCAHPGSSSQG